MTAGSTETKPETKSAQFHLTFTPPTSSLVHWPEGCWALYQITGDQLAERIVKIDGVVTERHSWCGFIGCYGTLAEVTAVIADAAIASA